MLVQCMSKLSDNSDKIEAELVKNMLSKSKCWPNAARALWLFHSFNANVLPYLNTHERLFSSLSEKSLE